jgi:hypothetical protein
LAEFHVDEDVVGFFEGVELGGGVGGGVFVGVELEGEFFVGSFNFEGVGVTCDV